MLLASLLHVLPLMCAAFSAAHVAAAITLEHTYPTPGNFSLVDLRCYNITTLFSPQLSGALFFANDTPITSQDGDGGVTHVITPETEGALTCWYAGKVSKPVLLAAEPRIAYECSSDDRPFHYQLLQYSEQDQYTLPCVIKPGRLRSRYEIVWVTAEPDSPVFIQHSTINLESFDITLNSNFLPQNDKFLSCRVRIRHDSSSQNERSYCGYRIRTAVQAEIVSVSESTTVEAGNSVNLTCTARGSQLHFKWTFRGQTFTKDESREGIRVRESSDMSPLTNTSRLLISGSSGLLDDAGQHMVTCTVTQDLQPGFNPAAQSSSGVLEITATVVTESESTASTGVFNHQNTKISIIIVPCMIVIIILGVSTLCFLGLCAKRKQWPVPVDGSVRDDGEASIKSDSDRSVPDRSGGHLQSKPRVVTNRERRRQKQRMQTVATSHQPTITHQPPTSVVANSHKDSGQTLPLVLTLNAEHRKFPEKETIL